MQIAPEFSPHNHVSQVSTLLILLLAAWSGSLGAMSQATPTIFDSIDYFPAPGSTESGRRRSAIDELQFRKLIRRSIEAYQGLAARHGANIALRIPVDAEVSGACQEAKDEETIMRCSWESDFTNADAGRSRLQPTWYIGISGGLARLPAMTAEGLSMVLCHEIGHLFGGFPFVREGFTGLALPVSVEGQADYFAAQVCLRKIWAQDDNTHNDEGIPYRQMIEDHAAAQCDSIYALPTARHLCYKTVFAAISFVKALGKINGRQEAPSVNSPDPNKVSATDNMHPAAQCRLDTFVAGALCPTVFEAESASTWVYYDETKIPGYDMQAPGSEEARSQSMAASCHENFWRQGARPRCWFSPEQIDEGGWMSEL